MGLHLNFELRLPGSSSRENIVETLVRLRAFAMRTAVRKVTELILIDRRVTCPLRAAASQPADAALISRFSRIFFGNPFLAMRSMARPTRSVSVMDPGATSLTRRISG